jgi:ferredoxin
MSERSPFPDSLLNKNGLNLQAIFDVAALPENIRSKLTAESGQLILIGHAGKRLWAAVQAAEQPGSDPIDDFTVATIHRWFADFLPGKRYQILYPGDQPIGLQALGKLAGWHQPSPFMVGIDSKWGSWFAYRAVILADTNFQPSPAVDRAPQEVPLGRNSPCDSCPSKVCISSCPAGALDSAEFSLQKCLAYRKQPNSKCQFTCLARVSCPVGREHQYSEEQLHHTYSISLRHITQNLALK